jgi:group II intron reverse transcriptase/maturase
VDPVFHPDSYGYRPGKSALDAVGKCRERCWKKDWVIDLDVQKFFDSVRWDLIVKAVEVHTDAPWVVLYVNRWLRAPIQQSDGTLLERTRGTPQGSSVSPVLANLFLHYAFDAWLVREFPAVEFERYADDAVVHCITERQARHVLAVLQERMEEVGLVLHPDKTKIVYCRDANRRQHYGVTQFTFLGFTFRSRTARTRSGGTFVSFQPAISQEALKKIGAVVRSWRLHHRTGSTFAQLARAINPVVTGWMRYYGAFYPSALHPLLTRINSYLVRWIRCKYRRLKPVKKARRAYKRAVRAYPAMFRHWQWTSHAWRAG